MIISPELTAAIEVADRVTILRDGGVAANETAGEFADDRAGLEASYTRDPWRTLPQNDFRGGGRHDA